jgi:tetratricopeptide (TPR) repeat protein
MRDVRINRIASRGRSRGTETVLDWIPPRRVPPDVILARAALDRRLFADAERHLRRALDAAPDFAEVRTLLGIVHESLGEHHAAYQCYRLALKLDRLDTVAGDGLRRYCQRFGYDPENAAINPAATEPA